MKPKLYRWLFRAPSRWVFWIGIAFICKAVLFCIQLHLRPIGSPDVVIPHFWGGTWGDTPSYLMPAENFIRTGNYSPDYRMPGYAVLYLPLLLFFSKATACNILIVIQLIASALSVYCLALAARYAFKKEAFFYLTFYLFAFSTYSCLYDSLLMTESLTTSLLVFCIYYFFLYLEKGKRSLIILSGICLAWTVFLRPVFAPFSVIFAALLFYKNRKSLAWLLFLIPLTIADGLWTARNFIAYHKFIPLTKSVAIYWPESSTNVHVLEFCKAWGGTRSPVFLWLASRRYNPGEGTPEIPENIFTSKFNADSLAEIHHLQDLLYRDTTLSPAQRLAYRNTVNQRLELYTASIKKEKPFLYYVKAPAAAFLAFFRIPYFSMVFLNPLTRTYSILSYYFILLTSVIATLLMFRFLLKDIILFIFPFTGLYMIIIHAVIFQANENRYLVPAFPFMLVCSAYLLYIVLDKAGMWGKQNKPS